MYVLQREMDGEIEYNFTIKPLRLTAARFHKCKEQKTKQKNVKNEKLFYPPHSNPSFFHAHIYAYNTS